MNHIGTVIKEYRSKIQMSRKALADDICSEKYVYLIEKGERSPSTDIVRRFGDRMGVDFFEYYQYLDCANPIAIRESIRKFNFYRRKNEFQLLQNVTEQTAGFPDFQIAPWNYEIEQNHIAHLIFVEKQYPKAIKELKQTISHVEPKYSDSVQMASLWVLLSICYQLLGALPEAKNAVLLAYEIIRNKSEIEKYGQIVITVQLCVMSLEYHSGNLNATIDQAEALLQYQSKINDYERNHYVYFYLAFAYYKKENHVKAIHWMDKAIYSVLAENKPQDVYYISTLDVFDIMLEKSTLGSKTIAEFKEKYLING